MFCSAFEIVASNIQTLYKIAINEQAQGLALRTTQRTVSYLADDFKMEATREKNG
jgi:hypothetical protein